MSNDRKDNIVKRIYIHGSVKLVSPLIVGSGENDNTDTDILRDSKGEPYIPGTAIAGVFRNYSNKKSRFIKEDKEISLLFGNQMNQGDDNSNNLMSSIIFSDANINKAVEAFEIALKIRHCRSFLHGSGKDKCPMHCAGCSPTTLVACGVQPRSAPLGTVDPLFISFCCRALAPHCHAHSPSTPI